MLLEQPYLQLLVFENWPISVEMIGLENYPFSSVFEIVI